MNMKISGMVIGAAGVVMLMIAMGMDTSVVVDSAYPSLTGMRVNNLGLISEKQNYTLIAVAFLILGVLLFGFGSVASKSSATSGEIPSAQKLEPADYSAEDLMRAIAKGDLIEARKIVNSELDLTKGAGSMSFVEYADLYDQVEIKELILMKQGS
jgi:hypothetical protein